MFAESATVGLLKLGLDAAALRHQAHASNVANANVQGYKRLGVRFEDQFSREMDLVRTAGWPLDAVPLGATAQLTVEPSGGKVELDAEVAHMAENVLRYQTMLKGLNKHLSMLSTAINEGKR